jgi:CheY-like chemotaxis protein/DNA-directed RNA polymerase specialized sigma24 family protein
MSTATKDAIIRELPYLRRYARALTGSQEAGDRQVRLGLEKLTKEPQRLEEAGSSRRQIYRLFHRLWDEVGVTTAKQGSEALQLERALTELALPERELLVLVSLENFSIAEAAEILSLGIDGATAGFEKAKAALMHLAKVDVLIIEDEAMIALAVGDVVEEMGHVVVGVATRADKAIEMAKETKPKLILADIQLEAGTSGIDAVQEILRTIDVPVIFVTAHPELLLTGETEEPAFLLTKPFEPLALKTVISQALSSREAA